MKNVVQLSYLWVKCMCTLEQAMIETKMIRSTVIRYWRRFRRLCTNYFNAHPITIGGPGTSVEIDESFMKTRKSQRGRRVRRYGRWIFGGTERGSNHSFMVLVRRRRVFVERTIRKNHECIL